VSGAAATWGAQGDYRRRPVLVGGARTPFGRLLGAISALSAAELGAIAIRGALERSKISAADVEQVLMGQVLTAGAGQLPARQAATLAGIGMDVPATNVGKVCLSGTAAIADAARIIRTGEADVVVAGGMESMSQAPHVLPGSRTGVKFGDFAALDTMSHDGLWDYFTGQSMGSLTESGNLTDGFSREEQDAYAVQSHARAAAAQRDGKFGSEIVPVRVERGRKVISLDSDEGVRSDLSPESVASLRPSFGGTITPASASPISDGAAAVVLMSAAAAEERGLEPIAELGAYASTAGPESVLQLQPARAIRRAVERQGIAVEELDVIEINEAFAVVSLASIRSLGVSPDIVNVNGGALALGHPIGASGARVVLHAALELQRRGGGIAAAALCGGGGQGDALLLRAPARATR
jgi:acetyl-CoA C-acetyltransferase